MEILVTGSPLRCGAVSQTPTYDQLRGERINADVPASMADLHPHDHPDRPHLRDDTPPAATAFGPPGLRGDGAKDWSGTGDGDRPGKHRFHDDAPGPVAVSGPSPGPGTDLAEGWFGAGESGRSGDHHATGPLLSGNTPSQTADQHTGSDHPGASKQALQALLPPPTHARDKQQHHHGGSAQAGTRKPALRPSR